MLKEIVVKVYPLIAKVGGVLCVDGGGTREVIPLRSIKRIEDRIKELIRVHIPL
jgi:hypothetical protein